MPDGYDEKSYYDLLGVTRNATEEEIRRAYRDIERVYSPESTYYDDVIRSPVTERDREIFELVTFAFETLVDPDKRAEYDQALDEYEREVLIRNQEQARAALEQQIHGGDAANGAAWSEEPTLDDVQNGEGPGDGLPADHYEVTQMVSMGHHPSGGAPQFHHQGPATLRSPGHRDVSEPSELGDDPPGLLELWQSEWTLFDRVLLFCAVGLPILTIITAIAVWLAYRPS